MMSSKKIKYLNMIKTTLEQWAFSKSTGLILNCSSFAPKEAVTYVGISNPAHKFRGEDEKSFFSCKRNMRNTKEISLNYENDYNWLFFAKILKFQPNFEKILKPTLPAIFRFEA